MTGKQLGSSDMMITRIGFGAWAIGGTGWEFGWGKQDDTESVNAILRALEHGINWIDTAAIYGVGHSEQVVAKALQEWKDVKPYVFTKCALRADEDGNVYRNFNRESILKECEDSLRRLKTDVIDLYQIHWPPEDNGAGLEEAWEALTDLQKSGKVRWIGVSNFNVGQMQRAMKLGRINTLQPPYSLLRPGIEDAELEYCEENNIGVIVYSPMASGLLSGGFTKERAQNLPKDDWRRARPDFSEPRLSKNLALVEKLKEIGSRHGRKSGEVAIAWTLRRKEVTGAIVGFRNPVQVDGMMGILDFRLSEEEINEIDNYRKILFQ